MANKEVKHLKTALLADEIDGNDLATREIVEGMLKKINEEGESAVAEYALKFDSWTGDFVLTKEKLQTLIDSVPQSVKDDIDFAHKQVTRFAKAQLDSLSEFEMETEPDRKSVV